MSNISTEPDRLTDLYKLLILVFIIWILSLFILPLFISELSNRGLFGDSFGAINSLFSGLAFAGIIFTILLQKKELALQRQELKDTRKELERSANAQEKSETQQRRQSDNLKITAKLNALSTLVSYYSQIEAKSKNFDPTRHKESKLEQERYIKRIKEILERKEN